MIGYYIIIAFIGYLLGAIPFAHFIVKAVTGEDITRHGTGNIGAMNVKRTTGSWGWFIIAMLADGCKGLYSVIIAQFLASSLRLDMTFASYLAIISAVIGHNYSIYFLPTRKRIIGGKGLATAGGGILAYNWTFLAVGIAVALAVIFATKYLLAGQITVTLAMPVYVWFVSPKDFIYITILCAIVFLKHAPRLPGLLTGKEPKWNVKDYHQVTE
jgi:glycerol-3-phosphate acyltransferase PlsY